MIEFLFNLIPKNLNIKTINRIREIIFSVIIFSMMFMLSNVFDTAWFVLISSIIFGCVQTYTYAFHCKNLDYCILLSNMLCLIFGYIAKFSTDYIWFILFIAVFCIKDIYLKTPLKKEKKYKDKKDKWFKKKFITIVFICLILFIILLKLNYKFLANSILCTFIMIDLILFINKE